MAPQEHHFLLFRHCPRKTSESYGALGDLPHDINKYFDADAPYWEELGSHWCLPASEKMMKRTGEWMIENGMINPGHKIQWEIISDDMTRDMDTAYYLSTGIRDSVKERKHTQSVGQDTIKLDARFFNPSHYGICHHEYHSSDIVKQISDRLKHSVPRPTLEFSEALKMLEELAGKGEVGELTKVMDLEPEVDPQKQKVSGTADFLAEIGEILYWTRIGGEYPYIPEATKTQVYQIVQFGDWRKSVNSFENTKSAVDGAPRVQAMFRVLSQGFQQRPSSKDEEYDTRVTVFLGHDYDLVDMATALGVRWILQEPYISGEHGAFLPTPPMSGIHAVRKFDGNEMDQIDLSFVYHAYAEHQHKKHFVLNTTGILEQTPLLFQKELKSSSINDRSTRIQSQGSQTSLDILQEHVLEVLSDYGGGAEECFHSATRYWAEHYTERAPPKATSSPTLAPSVDLKPSLAPTVILSSPVHVDNSRSHDTSFGMGMLTGLLIAFLIWSVSRFPPRQRSRDCRKRPARIRITSQDETIDESDRSTSGSESALDEDEEKMMKSLI